MEYRTFDVKLFYTIKVVRISYISFKVIILPVGAVRISYTEVKVVIHAVGKL